MAMVVTDLDGTLLDASARLGGANRQALERLGETGSLRVVATGGYASLISGKIPQIEAVDENLTLEGLRIIGNLNDPHSKNHTI